MSDPPRYGRVSGPRVRAIIAEVASSYGLEPKDITGKRRFKDFILARQEAMWRIRTETNISYPQIGRFIGNRDHTTAMFGVRQHEARLAAE